MKLRLEVMLAAAHGTAQGRKIRVVLWATQVTISRNVERQPSTVFFYLKIQQWVKLRISVLVGRTFEKRCQSRVKLKNSPFYSMPKSHRALYFGTYL